MNWKSIVRLVIPFIRMAGEDYKNKDANTTGKDDIIGVSLVYAADILESAISDKAPPAVPALLKK